MTSIIFLFELVHLNDLFCDEKVDDIVEEVDVKGVLKYLIFVAQKANAPKTGIEFCQGSNGAISYIVRRLAMSRGVALKVGHGMK